MPLLVETLQAAEFVYLKVHSWFGKSRGKTPTDYINDDLLKGTILDPSEAAFRSAPNRVIKQVHSAEKHNERPSVPLAAPRHVQRKEPTSAVSSPKKPNQPDNLLNHKSGDVRNVKAEGIAVTEIQTWTDYFQENEDSLTWSAVTALVKDKTTMKVHEVRPDLNNRIALWRGDITKLAVDAIVNNASRNLLGGDGWGVDGSIHLGAGPELRRECQTLGGCDVGEAKITNGYNLPAKHVIHTVGPVSSGVKELENCYRNSLLLMKKHKLHTIAFPCISAGMYGFPKTDAAHIALRTVRSFLEEHGVVDRVIFCVHNPRDVEIYEALAQMYFPVGDKLRSLATDSFRRYLYVENIAARLEQTDPNKADDALVDLIKDVITSRDDNRLPNSRITSEHAQKLRAPEAAITTSASTQSRHREVDKANSLTQVTDAKVKSSDHGGDNYNIVEDLASLSRQPEDAGKDQPAGKDGGHTHCLYDEDILGQKVESTTDFYPNPKAQ